MANKDDMVRALAKAPDKKPDHDWVGLADNSKSGVHFQCGTCKYFDEGKCWNKNPKLYGRKVEPEWCCNLYDHDGMKRIVD